MPPAGKKEEFAVPEERDNESPEWKENYQHARRKGNGEKAACLFADQVTSAPAE